MARKHVLRLTAEERVELTRLVRQGNAAGPAWPDAKFADAFWAERSMHDPD